jgi:hypothetical protein
VVKLHVTPGTILSSVVALPDRDVMLLYRPERERMRRTRRKLPDLPVQKPKFLLSYDSPFRPKERCAPATAGRLPR